MTKPAENSAAPGAEFHKRDWPYYWITRTSARYHMAMEKRLKPKGLDVPRWRVLMSLYEQDWLSVTEIADYCIIKLNTATKIIQRMEADGLVVTRRRASDGRATEVSMTPAGDARRRVAQKIAEDIFAVSFADLSEVERQVMNKLMERVFHRLGEL